MYRRYGGRRHPTRRGEVLVNLLRRVYECAPVERATARDAGAGEPARRALLEGVTGDANFSHSQNLEKSFIRVCAKEGLQKVCCTKKSNPSVWVGQGGPGRSH